MSYVFGCLAAGSLGIREAMERDVVVTLESGQICAVLNEGEHERAKSLELKVPCRSLSQEPKKESSGFGGWYGTETVMSEEG